MSIDHSMPRGWSNRRDARCKIVLLGDAAVGKSSIASRFVHDVYKEEREATIGASFLCRQIQVSDKSWMKLEIWDTAGQERYRSLVPMYYRGAAAAVVVYDVTSQKSFESAASWIDQLHKNAEPNIIITLVGNKCDLANYGARKVSRQQGEQLAADHHAGLFFEASAKIGINVDEAFKATAEMVKNQQDIEAAAMPERHASNRSDDFFRVYEDDSEPSARSCC